MVQADDPVDRVHGAEAVADRLAVSEIEMGVAVVVPAGLGCPASTSTVVPVATSWLVTVPSDKNTR